MRKLKLIRDFRGPSASKTAEDHEIHLKDYIQLEKLSDCYTGYHDINDMHSIAYMIVLESKMKPIRDALKPHRGQVHEQG